MTPRIAVAIMFSAAACLGTGTIAAAAVVGGGPDPGRPAQLAAAHADATGHAPTSTTEAPAHDGSTTHVEASSPTDVESPPTTADLVGPTTTDPTHPAPISPAAAPTPSPCAGDEPHEHDVEAHDGAQAVQPTCEATDHEADDHEADDKDAGTPPPVVATPAPDQQSEHVDASSHHNDGSHTKAPAPGPAPSAGGSSGHGGD